MKKGFTLIELLVVVLIIGILAAIALPQYNIAVQRARYTQLIINVKTVSSALERYWLANGQYTGDIASLDIEMPKDSALLNWYIDSRPNIEAVTSRYQNMEYVVYLQQTRAGLQGRTECRVYNDDKVVHQVCKSMGGNYQGPSGTYQIYLL